MKDTLPLSRAEGGADFVASLAKGLEVLLAFNSDQPEMTLSEVSRATGLSPGATRRFLLTLTQLGYLGKIGKRFVLKPHVLKLSSSYFSSMGLERTARPYLEDLNQTTGDSHALGVLDQHEVVYISRVSTKRIVRTDMYAGSRSPAYATSIGRALLAAMTPAALDAFLAAAEMPSLTKHTVTDPEKLRSILIEVREKGFAATAHELDYGVISVAVPILDVDGAAVAAVNCSTYATDMTKEEFVAARLPVLREKAGELRASLLSNPALSHSVRSATGIH
jgi:IclR family pca regulon transcriptional regulator